MQHYLFCPRQCALIHVEGQWAEDAATAEGRLLHERVDAGGSTARPGVRNAHSLALRSLALGVSGGALRENCQPEWLQRPPAVAAWLRTQLGE